VDARLLDDLVHFLDQENLTNRYYHLTLAGTAMGLTDHYVTDLQNHCQSQPENENCECNTKAVFRHWQETFVSQVQAAVTLTKGELTDIYIIQHEDCGAFRILLGKDYKAMNAESELELHQQYGEALQREIADNFCEKYNPLSGKIGGERVQKHKPFVHVYYMNLRGELTHISTAPGGRNPPECPCGDPVEPDCESSSEPETKKPTQASKKK
jgi:hypothetical protein